MITNAVFLRGKILDVKICELPLPNDADLLEVRFRLEVPEAELTEQHQVLVYGMQALRILGLVRAKLLPTEVMVEGRLSSNESGTFAIGRNITLFLSRRESKLHWIAMQALLPGSITLENAAGGV